MKMGHERIGFLPRTQPWVDIIKQLTDFDCSDDTVTKISNNTLANIKKKYEQMSSDESVIKAIRFLIILSLSANQQDQREFLAKNGLIVDERFSLFSLIRCAKDYIVTETGSLETNKMVVDAVLYVLSSYERKKGNKQLSLFNNPNETPWKNIGTGAAFCELARLFFAEFTNRHLRYYLEREAAQAIDDYDSIEIFSQKLTKQSEALSTHAFEISKIMQSFAAGWFNKYSRNDIPTNEEIIRFLNITFGKIRAELRREAEAL
jgi:hypothetical protein